MNKSDLANMNVADQSWFQKHIMPTDATFIHGHLRFGANSSKEDYCSAVFTVVPTALFSAALSAMNIGRCPARGCFRFCANLIDLELSKAFEELTKGISDGFLSIVATAILVACAAIAIFYPPIFEVLWPEAQAVAPGPAADGENPLPESRISSQQDEVKEKEAGIDDRTAASLNDIIKSQTETTAILRQQLDSTKAQYDSCQQSNSDLTEQLHQKTVDLEAAKSKLNEMGKELSELQTQKQSKGEADKKDSNDECVKTLNERIGRLIKRNDMLESRIKDLDMKLKSSGHETIESLRKKCKELEKTFSQELEKLTIENETLGAENRQLIQQIIKLDPVESIKCKVIPPSNPNSSSSSSSS